MGRGRQVIGLGTLALVAALLSPATSAVGGPGGGSLVVHGELQTVVVDDFTGHRSRSETTLLLRDGTRLDVRRAVGLPGSGPVTATVDVAEVEGRLTTRSREGLRVARTLVGEPVVLRDVRVAAAPAAEAGSAHRVFVAVVRNHGDWGGVSTATLRARVDRVLDGWEVEAGAALPSLDVAAWKDFSPTAGCGLGGSFGPVVAEARALFPEADVTAAPDHVVVLVPDECETGAVGTASVGRSLASGGVSVNSLEQDYGETTLAHELGHNFGLGHSGSEVCYDVDWCEPGEYADYYDVMGGATRGSAPALNSPHRDDLGLLATGEVGTLSLPADQDSATTTVTLLPRSSGAGLRTLRVIDPETLQPWYVDYRSGTDRDATAAYRGFPTYPAGVTVLTGESTESFLWGRSGYQTPRSWATGTTFTNPTGTVTMTVDAIDPGTSATVSVSVQSDAPPLPVPDTVAVTGRPVVDSYLDFDWSGWPSDAQLRFEWLVDGQPQPAHPFDYIWVAPEMRGSSIELVVTATRPGNRGVVRRSAPIGPVTNPVTGTVQIQAQPLRVGSPVTSSVALLPVNAVRALQWQVDGQPVAGATQATFTPTAAHVGGTVTLEVTASRTGYDTTVLESNALGPVPAPLQPGSSRIDGTPAVGSTVTSVPSGWPGGTTYTHQWLRDGEQVASGPTYTLRAADLGRQVAVRVRGTRSGESATVTSAAVTIVPGTLTAVTPTIAGRPTVGKRLTAKPGGWTDGTRFGYRWLANGRALRGATGPTLRLKATHAGKRISVRVTGTRPGYTSATLTSARTGKVRR